MTEKVEAYFGRLEGLSGEELDRSARDLALREKESMAGLIAHIAEISARKIHIEQGYKDLFDYCVRRLNLSEGSVWRRLQVVRVCRRFPEVLLALSENRLNLTTASLLAPHLSEENVSRLLAEAEGKSKREVDELIAALAPREEFRPSVRKQAGSEETGAAPSPSQDDGSVEGEAERPAVPTARSGESCDPRPILEPASAERYNYRFSAGKEFTEKFRRLAEVMGIESPQNRIEEVLEQALEIALEKKDPRRKLERRRKREAKKAAEARPGEVEETGGATGDAPEGAPEPVTSRYLPSEVRERVLERAGYQCEYSGPDGTRCTSRTGLEIEHERPFAIYRSHDEEFLRAYCRRHNRLAAERVYGARFIEEKIAGRQGQEVSATEPAACAT